MFLGGIPSHCSFCDPPAQASWLIVQVVNSDIKLVGATLSVIAGRFVPHCATMVTLQRWRAHGCWLQTVASVTSTRGTQHGASSRCASRSCVFPICVEHCDGLRVGDRCPEISMSTVRIIIPVNSDTHSLMSSLTILQNDRTWKRTYWNRCSLVDVGIMSSIHYTDYGLCYGAHAHGRRAVALGRKYRNPPI